MRRARGASDVADLQSQNLGQDQHALDVARATMTTLAQQGIAVDAGPIGARRAFAPQSERPLGVVQFPVWWCRVRWRRPRVRGSVSRVHALADGSIHPTIAM